MLSKIAAGTDAVRKMPGSSLPAARLLAGGEGRACS